MKPHEYRTRREKLLSSCEASVIVLAAHREMQRVADAAYEFTQESNFYYLTGISKPDWRVIMTSEETILVRPDVSETYLAFNGGMTGERALAISGANRTVSREQASELLLEIARSFDDVYTLDSALHSEYETFVHNPAPMDLRNELSKVFKQVRDCRPQLARLRAVKSEAELSLMQKAIDETIRVFKDVAQNIAAYQYEYELEAEFTYHFRRSGMDGHAYTPIVGGGANGCTLHYVANSSRLYEGGFVVIDIGASFSGYAADITRTYAIGEVSERHKDVHLAVQRAQKEIIELIGPGVSVREYLNRADDIMRRELTRLGLMKKSGDDASFRRYFPHAISHGLGLDVHDSLGSPDVFEPGMVLTVEPGIYIPEEEIGVRIEDDILVTNTGCRNLSESLSTGF